MPATQSDNQKSARPPRDGLVRALVRLEVDESEKSIEGCELREGSGQAAVDGSLGMLHGHFAVFNRWTEIDSFFEGNFMERIAPGAFKKTFREQRNDMRVLFQHGRDTQIGSKPLGPIDTLEEDSVGGAYEVPLIDTSYNRDLLPGLRAGLYGASFRFKVMREEMVDDPGASVENSRGLPERTIKEAKVMEFGPVTFPAYAEATAGVRSLTDWYGEGRSVLERLLDDPERLRALLDEEKPGREQPEREQIVITTATEPPAHADSRAVAERLDPEGTCCIAQMIASGADWVDSETDPEDLATMEGILGNLADLLQKEIAEPTPPEIAGDEGGMGEADAGPRAEGEEREGSNVAEDVVDEEQDEEQEDDSEADVDDTDTQGTTPGDAPTSTSVGAAPLHGTDMDDNVLLPEGGTPDKKSSSVFLP